MKRRLDPFPECEKPTAQHGRPSIQKGLDIRAKALKKEGEPEKNDPRLSGKMPFFARDPEPLQPLLGSGISTSVLSVASPAVIAQERHPIRTRRRGFERAEARFVKAP